ncbi:ACT domain-containing protein [Gracilibacillus oryzae]|uniref:ACT domain-containing protein n=1 Tax=Gracilibacillus oryzae TaxID=1672701 RepID=A0A7C8GR09_9BACI|nr:ACT domain-containing protein [Gracilibacillus oryzae]KAB8127385.1 ACT domain-containing protein [Gracilibacillus oryzae]
MQLRKLSATFSIVKIDPSDNIPSWAVSDLFISITKTDEELSIVCPTDNVPDNAQVIAIEHDWKCIKIEGMLDFALTGILASLANPLADNNISIFAISTYNTDFLMVKSEVFEKAKEVLEAEGHQFV